MQELLPACSIIYNYPAKSRVISPGLYDTLPTTAKLAQIRRSVRKRLSRISKSFVIQQIVNESQNIPNPGQIENVFRAQLW